MSTIRSYNPRCEITIYTPAEGGADGEVFGPPGSDAALDPMADVLNVTTQQSMGNVGGTFALTFTAREVRDGQTWADILPLYSAVVVSFAREPFDSSPQVDIIGLVESVSFDEGWGNAQPGRTIRVAGRSLASAVLQAHQVHYYPLTSGDPSLQYDVAKYTGAMFDERLFEAALNRPPQHAIASLLSKYLAEIDLRIPRFDLTRMIRFDLAQTSMFDAEARYTVPVPYRYGGSLWSILQGFVDQSFQEFFTLQDPDAEVTDVVFRSLPFNRLDGVDSFNTTARVYGLVDTRAPHVSTIYAKPEDTIAESWRRTTTGIFSAFRVLPAVALGNDLAFAATVPAIIDGDPESPTYFKRFGLKMMEVRSRYFPLDFGGRRVDDAADSSAVDLFRRKSSEWATTLRDWHRFNPWLLDGSVTLVGSARHRVGQRLVLQRDPHRTAYPNREAYIVGVHKTFDVASASFVSVLNVTRGFDVGAGVEA